MRHRHFVGEFLVCVLSVAFVAACGDDDSESTSSTTSTTSAEGTFCADADQLKTDLSSLSALKVPDDGKDAVKTQLDTVKSDLSTLKSSAQEVASTEISALETSLAGLESAVSSITGDLTASNAAAVVTAIEAVGTNGSAVVTKLEDGC
jgi:septal ring factor EnvC (AmiA/AmiB activator)